MRDIQLSEINQVAGGYLTDKLIVKGLLLAGKITKKCFDAWSRCSEWSQAATGKIWKNCNNHCIKDLHNPKGGRCVEVPNTCKIGSDSTMLQCQCYKKEEL